MFAVQPAGSYIYTINLRSDDVVVWNKNEIFYVHKKD